MNKRRRVLGALLLCGLAAGGVAGWHWLAAPAAGAAQNAGDGALVSMVQAVAEARDVPIWRAVSQVVV